MSRRLRWGALLLLVGAVPLAIAVKNDNSVPDKIAELLKEDGGCPDPTQERRSRAERPDWYKRFEAAESATLIACGDTAANTLYFEFRSTAALGRAVHRAPSRHGPYCLIGSAMFDGYTLYAGQPRAFCDELDGTLVRPASRR